MIVLTRYNDSGNVALRQCNIVSLTEHKGSAPNYKPYTAVYTNESASIYVLEPVMDIIQLMAGDE